MIQELNFQLVGYCNASCAFCPRNYHRRNEVIFMPMKLLEKIVNEVKSEKFSHKISSSYLGENGESTIHPKFIDMLRIVKNEISERVVLYTNFSCLNEEMAKIIVDENLLSGIACNIDGLTKDSYFVMKGLDLDVVEKNIKDFIKIRGDKRIPITINVLTAENYIKTVKEHFGTHPHHISKDYVPIQGEGQKIIDKWKPILSNFDAIGLSSCIMWAERKFTQKKAGDWDCFNKARFKNNAFIAPNGDWYACCFDCENKLVLGNLYHQTLDEIYNGEKRKKFIELIETKKFDEIGDPCDRVDACQLVHI